MNTLQQTFCGVIPPHMLDEMACHEEHEAGGNARTTLDHMRELAAGGVRTLVESHPPTRLEESGGDRQHVYDARHLYTLPGLLVLPGECFDGTDVHVTEAWDNCGATDCFYLHVFKRRSIDGLGMRIDSTVHYGKGFQNAMWTGGQMVYGDGDGVLFTRFTKALDVTAHELTHGMIQNTASLGYTGQTGALNEHLADTFGLLAKQYTLRQTAEESDWRFGAGLYGDGVCGSAIRSFALPGSAYDDPILGTDPQPSHMDDYVHTAKDNGGVHINSGILNHAFYLAAKAIGGYAWRVLGRIWYAVLTEQLVADAGFDDFARATVVTAGEMYGIGSRIQQAVGQAWADVGLPESDPFCPASHDRATARRTRCAAVAAARRRTRWHRDVAARRSLAS